MTFAKKYWKDVIKYIIDNAGDLLFFHCLDVEY